MTQQTYRKPTHRLFNVVGDGEAARWTEIGAAWPNKDGRGFSLTCAAMPLQGRIVMRAVPESATPTKKAAKAA